MSNDKLLLQKLTKCLNYFEQKDAFTGQPLRKDEYGFAYIIPPLIKEIDSVHNMIPCNLDTITFMDEYALTWYQSQSFYDSSNFKNICEWMSKCDELSHYQKYKYVNDKQLRYIDTFDNNVSINIFKIFTPDKQKITLQYSNRLNRNAFIKQVYHTAIKQYEDRLNNNWLDNSTKTGQNSVSRFLDRCADYILLGEYDYEKNMRYTKTEIPASNISSELVDMFECGGSAKYEKQFDFSGKYTYTSDFEDEIVGKHKHRNNHQKCRKRKKSQTSFYKIDKLFSKPHKRQYSIDPLLNMDIYSQSDVVKLFPNWEERVDDIEKWMLKKAKNIFGQTIYNASFKTYDGRDGIIKYDKPYTAEWAYVNADAEFIFQNHGYRIDTEKHPKYIDLSKTKLKGNATYWSQDKILCIEQFGKVYFWDMNINEVEHVICIDDGGDSNVS